MLENGSWRMDPGGAGEWILEVRAGAAGDVT